MLLKHIHAAEGRHAYRMGFATSTSLCTRRCRSRMLWQQQQQQQQWPCQLLLARVLRHHSVTRAAVDSQEVSFEWSWRQGKSKLPGDNSPFDALHPVPSQLAAQELLGLLSAAAAASSTEQLGQQPSQAWMQKLEQASLPLIQQMQAAEACQALQHLSQLDFTPDDQWMTAAMQQLCTQLPQLSTAQLSGLLWSLSNLRHTPHPQQWTALLQAAATNIQDFYGPDLAQFVCAAGSIYANSNSSFDLETGARQQVLAAEPAVGTPPAAAPAPAAGLAAGQPALALPEGWQVAVAQEVQYQVTEFVGDLGAFDLARLASGLADLGITPSSSLQDVLLKAVYMRTRTIEEKGAVDFALAKLDAKGKKSMHYDPRWTHEELHWLPRRERDKRRILKEGWYRTQWSGWRSRQ